LFKRVIPPPTFSLISFIICRLAAIPISLALKKVADAGYNITTITTANAAGQLSDDDRDQLARWLDSLDRF